MLTTHDEAMGNESRKIDISKVEYELKYKDVPLGTDEDATFKEKPCVVKQENDFHSQL